MSKRYKYSIFIASAILACAPLAVENMGSNHVVQAATTNPHGDIKDPAPSNKPRLDDSAKTKDPAPSDSDFDDDNDAPDPEEVAKYQAKQKEIRNIINSNKNNVRKGDTIETAYKVNIKYDQNIHTKIKATKGLTIHDLCNYVDRHAYAYINDKPVEDRTDYSNYINNKETENSFNEVYGYDAVEDDLDKNINPHYTQDEDYVNPNGATVYQTQELDKDGNSFYYEDYSDFYSEDRTFLKSGDQITVGVGISDLDLLPNKWYSWKLYDGVFSDDKGDVITNAEKAWGGKLPVDVMKKIHFNRSTGIITEKTTGTRELPADVLFDDEEKDPASDSESSSLGENRIAPVLVFSISDDQDAFEIPHDSSFIGKERNHIGTASVVPDDEIKDSDSADDEIIDDPSSNSQSWNNASVDVGTPLIIKPTSASDVQNTIKTNKEKVQANQNLDITNFICVHNAYVYDHTGKVITTKGDFLEVGLFDKVKILDNGKVYNIKGKSFYRIGNNKYIKVANVGKAPKAQKINTRGTIKATHKYGVRLYNSKGKALKKILRHTKKVRFDQKKLIGDKVYYHIKGTKSWVRSGNIKFVKGAKKELEFVNYKFRKNPMK